MRLQKRVFVLLFLLLCAGLIIGGIYLEKIHLRLSHEEIDICNNGPGLDGEGERTKRFWKKIQKINDKIETARFFAKLRSSVGYVFLSDIVCRLTFSGNTEYAFSKAYEALGYLGRFDQRAADLLVLEFKSEEDPTQAMDIMRALIISENRQAIFKIRNLALQKLEGIISNEEREKLLMYEIASGKLVVLK